MRKARLEMRERAEASDRSTNERWCALQGEPDVKTSEKPAGGTVAWMVQAEGSARGGAEGSRQPGSSDRKWPAQKARTRETKPPRKIDCPRYADAWTIGDFNLLTLA